MIPYLIMIILVGAPLMTVEMGLGQFCPLPIGSLFKAINLTYAGQRSYGNLHFVLLFQELAKQNCL